MLLGLSRVFDYNLYQRTRACFVYLCLHPGSQFTILSTRPVFFGHCQLSLFIYLRSTSGLSLSCCRWPELNNIVRSRPYLNFVRSSFTRAHPSESELTYAIKYFLKHNSFPIQCFLKTWIYIEHWILSPIQETVLIFEMNFKRTINCPTTRANMNEPNKQKTDRLYHCSVMYITQEVVMRTSHLSLRN